MPAKITATEQNLDQVFSDSYFFEIPPYQRPYAWTVEHVEELLDDLTDALRRDKDAPYFLGSIVLIKSDDAKSEVVDGQQRLTTLTMLLCVLRDLSSEDDLDGFVRQAGNKIRGTEDRFRLSARQRDRRFFEENILEKDSLEDLLKLDPKLSDSQKCMFENVRYLSSELQKLDEEGRRELASYVAQKCFLVVVSASDGEAARRIFSVMNNRGLDLSPTDVLKAEVLDAISDSKAQDEYSEKWEGIEEELGRDSFRELFAHIRMIYRKDKLRETLESEFRKHVLHDLSPEKAIEFVDDGLESYADAYEIVSRASYESTENAEKVNELLSHLNRLDNFDWIPPAIAYYRRMVGQTEWLLEFTRNLERLAYGLFVRRANINERIERYARVISTIESGDALFEDSSPLQLSYSERTEILERLNGDIYNQLRVRTPLLLRLDSIVAEKAASYHHPIVSIEHVLPQNPPEGSQWMDWFQDEEERNLWTHRLANLVLLSRRKNTRASNYEFGKKKSEYFQRNGTTTFALTTGVVDESEWTPTVLEGRQQKLIDALKREWRPLKSGSGPLSALRMHEFRCVNRLIWAVEQAILRACRRVR